MKYFLSVFFLSFCLNHLSAQEKHFVFIQSDNKQPFYVSLNGKLYSSSASGYVIIPKLVDGNYNFTIGFAQNAYPEQTFTTTIQDKDLGYDLKNFADKGWGLFNLQTLDVTMASGASTNVVAEALNQGSKAKADDDVISFNKKKEPPKVKATADTTLNIAAGSGDIKAPVAKADSSVVVNQKPAIDNASSANQPANTSESVIKTNKSADVKKVSEVAGEEGVSLSYVEGNGKNKDTVHVIIPTAPVSATPSAGISKNDADLPATGKPQVAVASGKNDPRFLDINMAAKKDTVRSVPSTGETFKVMENSNCKNVASEDDYWKLRKKMSMETTDEKMINEAKKFYRNKCFTTSQIKGLSTLFLSDEGRFKFFDASFVSVADANQYYTLQSEFIDPAFVNRFKALLQ